MIKKAIVNPIFKLVACLWGCLFIKLCYPQTNIYSLENRYKYAKHLEQSGQYSLAAKEYAQIYKLSPSDSLITFVCRNYRQYGLADSALAFLDTIALKNETWYYEWINTHLICGKFKELEKFLENDTVLSLHTKKMVQLDAYLLQGQWKKAEKQLEGVEIQPMERLMEYNNLVDKGLALKKKKLFPALVLSAIVPGLGKVYAGAPWEGLSTFGITALLALSSARGFYIQQEGSIPGWIFAAATVTFYVGNLHGTAKQVKKYNQLQDDKVVEQAKGLIFYGE